MTEWTEARQKVEALRKRLASASQNDRAYERPVSWDGAEWLASLAHDYIEYRIKPDYAFFDIKPRNPDEAYRKAWAALHHFAHVSGCPAGTDVLKHYQSAHKEMVDRQRIDHKNEND